MTADKSPPRQENSESLWIESESIRVLMQARRGTTSLAALGMVLMAALALGSFNIWLVLAWLALSILFLIGRVKVKQRYKQKLIKATLAAKTAFIERSSFFWHANAFTWGVSGFLFFTDAAPGNQYAARAILAVVAFVAVFNLCAHRYIAVQFINILLGVQVVGALSYLSFSQQLEITPIQYAHLVALISLWVVFMVMINRLHENFRKNLSLQYRNDSLIRSLEHQAEQLAQEKQVALNANETIKRFYSSAAHDIRQPVYALNVYADLISDDPVQTLKLLPKIKASCHAINALFHSLFDFEKIHSGQINIAMETVDLPVIFEELQAHFQPLAEDKKIDLRVFPVNGRLQSDHALIKGILSHLLSNAIKYTNEGGVLLAARKTGQNISLEVWDTGIGINDLHQKHVFDEFFKVKEQSSADEGFGLGLSVVKRLAAFVEGSSIELQSRVGRGSVFKFRVPLIVDAGSNTRDQQH